jgi:hypothetical protein
MLYKLANSLMQDISLKVGSYSSGAEKIMILWNWNIHYRNYKGSSLDRILN